MLAFTLAFNPRSKATNIGYLLSWGADCGCWSKTDAVIEKPVSGLPEELLKRATKKYPILFRCAKRSILPSKAETSQKRMRSFYGQNSTAQSHKIGYFLAALYLIVFVQSGSKAFTAAVYSKFYKLMKEGLRKGINLIYFLMEL